MKYAIVDKTFTVINIVKWNGVSNWMPPVGTMAIQSDIAQIGDIYDPNDKIFRPDTSRLAVPDSQ